MVVIPQWANDVKISDNVRNIKKDCSPNCIMTSKITDIIRYSSITPGTFLYFFIYSWQLYNTQFCVSCVNKSSTDFSEKTLNELNITVLKNTIFF